MSNGCVAISVSALPSVLRCRPPVAGCLLMALSLSAGVVAGESAIFWQSDPVRPGETAMLIGAGFGDGPQIEIAALSSESQTDGPGNWRSVETLQATGTSVKFVVPLGLPTGIFAYRIKTVNGVLSGLLNRPRVWWTQGDAGTTATPGGAVRLFGKNLGLAKARSTVRLTGPRELTLPAKAEVYAAQVQLPGGLPPGDYTIALHNGHGGQVAWSEPLSIQVRPRKIWPDTALDVRTFGAVGDGQKDDTAAIAAALAKAGEAGGGVVYFPRGRYRVSDTLSVPRFTVMRGQGEDLVALAWTAFDDPPEALVRGSNSFGLEALTLYAKNHCHIIVGDLDGEPGAGDVFLRRVRVRANRYRGHPTADDVDALFRRSLSMPGASRGDAVRVGGANVEITDCDIYGSGRCLFLGGVRNGRVERNRLFTGRRGWYCVSGSDGLIFADNEITGADLQSSGGGLNCLNGAAYSQNVYFARNRLSLMHGWDREAMTSDAGGQAYFGKVQAAEGTALTLAGPPSWGKRTWRGAGVFILEGRGAGQCRRIVKCQGDRVEIDRPWTVAPDRESVLSITMFQGHYLLIDNQFSDTGPVQFYGVSIENIVAGNVGTRMAGFSALGLWYHGYQPSWFCQLLGNTIKDGNYYHWNAATTAKIKVYGAKKSPYAGPLSLGAVIRRNTLQSNATIDVRGTVRDAVVEGNHVAHTDVGIFVSGKTANVWVGKNTFDEVPHPTVDEVAMRAANLERLKRFIGAKDPVAVWHFDKSIGNSFPDSSGNGFHARAEGDGGLVLVDDAVRGRAVRFGGGNYLRVDEPAVFNAPDLTFSFWIKPEELTGHRGLLVKRFGNTAAPFVLVQQDRMVRVAATEADGPWGFNHNTPPLLSTDVWTHVGVVFTAGHGVTTFINGKLVAEKQIASERATNGSALFIGREAWGDPSTMSAATPGFYKGLMDEIKIWTRALSPEELQAEARSASPAGQR